MIGQIQRHFGDLFLNQISVQDVEMFQNTLIQRGLKPGGVNRLVSTFKAMISKAVDWNMATEETLKRIRKVKNLKGEQHRLKYLTNEEIHRLINSCTGALRAVVITALNTGMRRGEILNLKWSQIDLKNGFILLDTNTKTGRKREIPINATLRATLQNIPRRIDTPKVFPDIRDFRKSFASALKKAGIDPDFRFHDLRHTFASHLVMSGVDITTVSKLLGHTTVTMTLRYAHLAPAHLVSGVQKLDNIFYPQNSLKKAQNE